MSITSHRKIVLLSLLILMILVINKNVCYAKNTNNAIYFYSPTCTSCLEINKIMNDGGYSNIRKIDVSKKNNLDLFRVYCKYYHVPENKQSTPMIFYGDSYAQNKREICSLLKSYNANKCTPILKTSNTMKQKSISVKDVFLVGLVNGLNPCSLSILFFLFTTVISINTIEGLLYSFMYIFGKFISFLALGLVIFQVLDRLNITFINYFIKILFCIICGILIVSA